MRGILPALLTIASLAACHRDTPEELAQAGMERHRAREYAQAIELYRESLELHEDPAVRGSLARALAAYGNSSGSAAEYQRLLKAAPQNGALWLEYGLLLETGLEDLQGAEEALFNATQYPPKPPEASYRLGLVLMQRRRYEEAGACFEAAVNLAAPTSSWLEDARQQQIQAFLLAKPR